MYTQCPDCSTAFRVTADVLKQAAGKVRCGGCGNAFNALAYLSESMPEQPAPKDPNEALPELTPEPMQKSNGLPASISAEQSAALLKTLDELAGSNIRIEDTGVEWRVLDDDEVGEAADDPFADENDIQSDEFVAPRTEVDEFLEESPTPVDQFLTETPAQIDSPEIFEEAIGGPARTTVDELRFDDNTPLPDDFDLDDESLFAPAESDEPDDDADEPLDVDEEEPQADFDLSEPDEWTDILGEFEDLAVAAAAPLDAELDALEVSNEDEDAVEDAEPEADFDDDSSDELLDMDSQFALQAEAMGIDLSGMHESLDEPEIEDDLDLELLLEDSNEEPQDIEDLLEEDLVAEVTDDDETAEDGEVVEDEDEVDDDYEPDEDTQLDLIEDHEEDEEDEDLFEEEEEDAIYIPPLSAEEQTINMQIDQDLLALAIEDEDGFASTIVIPDGGAEEKARKGKGKGDDKDIKVEPILRDTNAGFETIIMEGECIRTEIDSDKLAADSAAAASLAGAAAAERETEQTARVGKRRWGMIGGVVVLVLVLTVQVLHQSREALATIPAFNSIAGPLYRSIGMPLSPEWDITGWRFEATKGSTDENDEHLTIYSRIGNKSEKPLPYPIVAISLTDRFEETVGSRILDPAEYLSNDLDPRKLVEPGNTFNAAITIRSPAEEATGFKLNVCYRESGGDLRCAIDDFK